MALYKIGVLLFNLVPWHCADLAPAPQAPSRSACSPTRTPIPPRCRALALLLCSRLSALPLMVEPLHDALLRLMPPAEPTIAAHPVAGTPPFVLLSALSAMVAFFSAALLVPVAVYSWGTDRHDVPAVAGLVARGPVRVCDGSSLGRPLLATIGAARVLAFYRERLPERVPFALVLLMQLALPSEIPGYLSGLLRVRARTYLAALALAELPFVVGTVLVGESVVEQRGGMLVLLGAIGAGISLYALLLLRRRLQH